MADISKITPPGSQTTYNLKDATAREQANWNTNNGVKNLLKNNAVSTVNNTVTFTVNNDKSIRVQGKPSSGIAEIVLSDLSELVDGQTYKLYGNQFTKHTSFQIVGGQGINNIYATEEGTEWTFVRANYVRAVVRQDNEATTTDATIYPMITIPTIADNTYEPYALPNTKITPELIELVDSGAKNKLNCTLDYLKQWNQTGTWNGNKYTKNNVEVVVNSDGTLTVTANNATNVTDFYLFGQYPNATPVFDYSDNTYVYCNVSGSSNMTTTAFYRTSGVTDIFEVNGNTPAVFSSNLTGLFIRVSDIGTTYSATTIKPMICTKVAWDVSQKFVPYRPTYEETVEQLAENKNNILKCSTYTATVSPVSGTATFTELLRNARDTLGVTGMFTCEISIYTETFGENMVMYVQIQPFVNESHTVLYNNVLALNATNIYGTIVITGCTSDCTAKVRIYA